MARSRMSIAGYIYLSVVVSISLAQVDQQSCSQSFDVMFRRCLNHIPMVAENFFSVVADQADNRTMKSVCDDSYSSMIQRCSHGAVQELKVTNTQCNKQEITQVRQNVKDTMSAYDEKCMSSTVKGGFTEIMKSRCVQRFTASLQKCLLKRAHVGIEAIMGLLSKDPIGREDYDRLYAHMSLMSIGPIPRFRPSSGNKEHLLSQVCENQAVVHMCVGQMKNHIGKQCSSAHTIVNMVEKITHRNCRDYQPKVDCARYVLCADSMFNGPVVVETRFVNSYIHSVTLLERYSYWRCDPAEEKYGISSTSKAWWVFKGCGGVFEVRECTEKANTRLKQKPKEEIKKHHREIDRKCREQLGLAKKEKKEKKTF